MTKIPGTVFYDSPFLTDVRNNGIRDGIEWMRETVIEIIKSNPEFSWNDQQIIDEINKTYPGDYADVKRHD